MHLHTWYVPTSLQAVFAERMRLKKPCPEPSPVCTIASLGRLGSLLVVAVVTLLPSAITRTTGQDVGIACIDAAIG
jgi:hypothetical protein